MWKPICWIEEHQWQWLLVIYSFLAVSPDALVVKVLFNSFNKLSLQNSWCIFFTSRYSLLPGLLTLRILLCLTTLSLSPASCSLMPHGVQSRVRCQSRTWGLALWSMIRMRKCSSSRRKSEASGPGTRPRPCLVTGRRSLRDSFPMILRPWDSLQWARGRVRSWGGWAWPEWGSRSEVLRQTADQWGDHGWSASRGIWMRTDQRSPK